MKGMIFTEFFEMVDETFSPEMVEKIIDASNLATKGAYTEIGTYDYQELVKLVTNLSRFTNIPIPELEVAYGKYLFKKLLNRYSHVASNVNSSFEFLSHVDQHVHVEVLKLYPDAELPRFECAIISPNQMIMEYRSNHPFASLAEGLILGCGEYYHEKLSIKQQKLPPKMGKQNVVLFTLSKE